MNVCVSDWSVCVRTRNLQIYVPVVQEYIKAADEKSREQI
jgi:hypothetical protein